MTGELDELQEKYHSAMVHHNKNISRLMVHSQQVEEARAKRKSKDAKRARSFDGVSSKNMLEIQHKPRVKKQVYSQVPSKFPKSRDDRES